MTVRDGAAAWARDAPILLLWWLPPALAWAYRSALPRELPPLQDAAFVAVAVWLWLLWTRGTAVSARLPLLHIRAGSATVTVAAAFAPVLVATRWPQLGLFLVAAAVVAFVSLYPSVILEARGLPVRQALREARRAAGRFQPLLVSAPLVTLVLALEAWLPWWALVLPLAAAGSFGAVLAAHAIRPETHGWACPNCGGAGTAALGTYRCPGCGLSARASLPP